MEFAIVGLLALSIVLLLLSFFKRDSINELQEQVEELSMSHIQETYQLKKKISVLEEELLMSESTPFIQSSKSPSSSGPGLSSLDREKISSLFQGSLSPDQSVSKVDEEANFLEQIRLKGEQHE
ncbi:hypothetical protein [Bacillus sp. PS06]|uniref:hypothetical protein n=1 Tax=Bacillus sp. PS06 TaxID=2764176 RepID=UPI00178402CC|nr:hypothetical protein [Bacillus sp. PS06]MBD8069147.1 hypothetical protein [Bacillus sp. PS06]